MGSFLEVVADQPRTAATAMFSHTHSLPVVAPTLAIGLVATAVGVYLLTIGWLNRHIAQGQEHLGWAWGVAFAILVGNVGAVAAGLPLAGAIAAVPLAPAFIVFVIARKRHSGRRG